MAASLTFLEEYFQDLLATRQTGGGVKEESYYDALSNLLNAVGDGLKPRVRCVLQLANQGGGHPDGGLFTEEQWKQGDLKKPLLGLPQSPSRGAIEIKPTSDDAWITADTKQVTKYWHHYRLVLVTNYRDFVLVGQDQAGNPVELETYRLAENEHSFWAQAAYPKVLARRHGGSFPEFLHRVLLHAAPLTTPRDVAWFLASYARTAMSRIEGQELPALTEIRAALEEALGLKFVGDKGEHFFRSTFVQTLFYGVFSAWVLWAKGRPETSKEQFDWRTAVWYLRVPIIQAMFSNVATPAKLGPLRLVQVLDWTGAALNRVSRNDFFSAFEEGRAVQYFYEPFLAAFDPVLQKDLGVWYTPPEIVQYMVERVDRVLREELNLPDGLADPSVYVLDPGAGTGSYLVEVLTRIATTLRSTRGDALVANDLKEAAIKRVLGLEILPASFVVAHLQMGLFLQNAGAPLDNDSQERVGVYLTNALTGWEPGDPKTDNSFQAMLNGFPELLEERDSAREVKRKKPILVVLGNPPYNAFAGTSPAEEQGLVEPYKEGLVKEWGTKKFNLDDLYVRFFRLAERRIAEQTGRGIISYISNFSYLGDPSFVVMRKRFLNEFDRMWFDNMNGDSRATGKRTPDGKPDPSVFSTEYNKAGIRVGTAVSVLLRKEERSTKPVVGYREFWGGTKRADLLESLNAADFDSYYQAVYPTKENRYSFRPEKVSDEYLTWPRVVDLSAVEPYNGPIERRANSLIRFPDQKESFAVLEQYLDPNVSDENARALEPRFMRSSGEFKAEKTRAAMKGKVNYCTANIVRYPFKPFDVRLAYLDSDIAPLFSRPAPNLLYHRKLPGNAFLITRDTADKADEGPPFYYSSYVCDYDFISGHARHIPTLVSWATVKKHEVHEEQAHFLDQAEDTAEGLANLSYSARQYLAFLGVLDPDKDGKTAGLLWLHCLAIGYSPAYMMENRDGIRRNWPRIPLPKTRETFEESGSLGQKMTGLLDTDNEVPGVTTGSIRLELKVVASITREGGGPLQPEALALSVGWGHPGQNGVVMPGKGKVVERDYSPKEIQAIEAGAKALSLTSEEVFRRLGDLTCDVYLNDVAYWSNIPKNVWRYMIRRLSGHKKVALLSRRANLGTAFETRRGARGHQHGSPDRRHTSTGTGIRCQLLRSQDRRVSLVEYDTPSHTWVGFHKAAELRHLIWSRRTSELRHSLSRYWRTVKLTAPIRESARKRLSCRLAIGP